MTPPPTRLGDFEILRELGRGGMGVVYEAVQTSLGRRVALKVLSAGLGLTPTAVDRFRREAAAAAKLHHTNIVPVYATGEQGGTHFYAMELIDGPSLDAVIGQLRAQAGRPPAAPTDLVTTNAYVPPDPLSAPTQSGPSGGSSADRFDRIAAMAADVADALHHAHQSGVTHRDVKPSNLMLSADGRLSVTDFGLARVLEQPGVTVTGEFVGTPAYMSPEQVTAGRVPVDHRTDVYSLGATLYELLTLRPPFAADGRDKLLAMVVQKEPPPPRSVDPKVPRDLETICLKCLEKDPDRRYQSAKDLADDLRRYVHRFAIAARRAGPWTRAAKWAKRHPAVAALLGCLLAAVLAAGGFAYQAQVDRDRLRAEQRQAAVENAILEAMSGDAPAALQAVAAAEALGAEPGRLNLLRGAVEYYRGRPREAVVYLEQADQQLPQSVAVKALLARAFIEDGRTERYAEMVMAQEPLEAKTPEDHLFRALCLTELDPPRGLQILDGAPARFRQSPVARLVRCILQTWKALMTGREEDAEQALDDLRKVDLPDHPLLLALRVRAEQTAARAYGPTDPRREQAWGRAARDVERLARHRDNRIAVQERCYYHLVRGEDDALLATARQARRDRVADTWVMEMEASVLYGRKEYDEALRALQSAAFADDQSMPVVFRGAVLAAMPGRKDEAEQTIVDAVRACRGSGVLSVMPAYLQLLGPGYGAKVREMSLEIRERQAHLIPTYRDRWLHHLLAFHAGLLDDGALLKKAGEYRTNQCEGHFYIGLRRLADGKRSEAKACFRRVLGTGAFLYEEYYWSRAFLARIDDPAWMPWVPME